MKTVKELMEHVKHNIWTDRERQRKALQTASRVEASLEVWEDMLRLIEEIQAEGEKDHA